MASPLVSLLQGLTTCGPADRPWLFDRCRNSFLEMILPAAVGEARDLDPITEKGEEKKEREEEEEEGTGWGVVRREKEERDWEEKLRAEGPGRPPGEGVSPRLAPAVGAHQDRHLRRPLQTGLNFL